MKSDFTNRLCNKRRYLDEEDLQALLHQYHKGRRLTSNIFWGIYQPITWFKISISIYLAHWRIGGGGGQFGKIVCWCTLYSWHPNLGKTLDPPLIFLASWNYVRNLSSTSPSILGELSEIRITSRSEQSLGHSVLSYVIIAPRIGWISPCEN